MKLEDELDTMMKARIEQSDAWNDFHTAGDVSPRALQRLMAAAMAAQRDAILRLAREIDELHGSS